MYILSKRLIKRIKESCFNNLLNTIISIFLCSLLIYLTILIVKWLCFDASWNVITQNIPLYLFGLFPKHQAWRPIILLILLIFLCILTVSDFSLSRIKKLVPFAWLIYVPLGLWLLAGGYGLSPVPTSLWGGLILTIFLTLLSLSFSLPIGILLAFGRQSNMILISRISKIYINFMRSIPLIAVLFFGQLLVPLFLPSSIVINRFARAVLAFTLFVSAYIAEDVRGGLQSIPTGQKEACLALGFNPIQSTIFIILPQALRVALPALTNQAVGLLQNTSLMAILGLVELLGISRSLLANPEFIGRSLEVYVFLALVYWIICTIIAILSRHIEKQLDYNRIISK